MQWLSTARGQAENRRLCTPTQLTVYVDVTDRTLTILLSSPTQLGSSRKLLARKIKVVSNYYSFQGLSPKKLLKTACFFNA